MADEALQSKLLAFAVYEIRLLLAGHLGSNNQGDAPVNAAAHLAYALHNEALAVQRGEAFDMARALGALGAADRICNADFLARFERWAQEGDA